MKTSKLFLMILIAVGISIAAAGCDEGPCMVTGITDLTVYRLPHAGSEVFGTLPAGESHEVLARTADGWVGFDPGIAQAGNIGLAHHRWIQLNASLSPFCLASVDLVTLEDVIQDMGINNLNPPDLVITDITLPPIPVTENLPVPIEVTVENQGGGLSLGYEIFIFPGYGKGTQMPTEQEPVPDLAAGDSHTFTFSPGVAFPAAGDYILRVLVTDNWNTPSGGPNSTGTNGDLEDVSVHVSLGLCNPFSDMEVSVVLLNLNPDTGILPVYLKTAEAYFPGFDPAGSLPNAYSGDLSGILAHLVSQQDFPDRLYFMFRVPEEMEDTSQTFQVWLPDCPEPVLETLIQVPAPKIPDPKITCHADLNQTNCEAAGGSYKEYRTTAGGECICP